jgi:Ion channel
MAWCVMALCVVIHATALSSSISWIRRQRTAGQQFWPSTWLFVRLAGWIIVFHLLEIAAWAGFYLWQGAIADWQSAFYFSAVTYTTTGYGDVVLPTEWRLEGGVEALTGILMCGWSTGFFFAIVSRLFDLGGAPTGHKP